MQKKTESVGSRTAVIARALAGDQEAFDELWYLYAEKLSLVACGRLKEHGVAHADSDDVVQSSFGEIQRRAKEGGKQFASRSEFWNWLVTVAKNRARNHVRSHHNAIKRRRIYGESVDQEDTLTSLVQVLVDMTFEVDKLKDVDERAVEVFFDLLGSKSVGEIADRYGVCERTIYRLKQMIRKQLADEYGPETNTR